MNRLNGSSLNKFPLRLKYVADLIYFDGPLLSWFKNEEQESYFYYWCDVNEHYNRWLVFKVSNNSLIRYFIGKCSLKSLILNSVDGFIYSVDIDDDLEIISTLLTTSENLPTSYIPEEDSYHEPSLINPEQEEEVKDLIKSQALSILNNFLVQKSKPIVDKSLLNKVSRSRWKSELSIREPYSKNSNNYEKILV